MHRETGELESGFTLRIQLAGRGSQEMPWKGHTSLPRFSLAPGPLAFAKKPDAKTSSLHRFIYINCAPARKHSLPTFKIQFNLMIKNYHDFFQTVIDRRVTAATKAAF